MKLEWIISSSVLILVVLALRAVLGKRISARLRYALWALVLLRLLIPVQLYASPVAGVSAGVPQLPASFQEESIYVIPVDVAPAEKSNVWIMEDGTIGDLNSFGYPRLENDGETVVRYADRISPLEMLSFLWKAGAVVLVMILLAANLRFARRLRRMRKPMDVAGSSLPVYQVGGLPSPCLFGVLRPAVYVTGAVAGDDRMMRHIMAHELTHYRHLDHIWSIFRGIALAIHWWNPLVWLAVVLSRRDGELACDEGALQRLGDGERPSYGETLLALVTAKAGPWDLFRCATTMTGGKKSLKERIQRIAHRQKILVSASVITVAAVILFTVTAFGQKDETGTSGTPQRADLAGGFSLDLDWDGESETAWVHHRDHQKDGGTPEWTLDIIKGDYMVEDVTSIWSVTLDESHGGCDTYFLYQKDGLDYLLEYMPKMQQGQCIYSYRLFHLENEEEVTDQANFVEFDINFSSEGHCFDPAEIASFMMEVNSLIGESTLLVNTNHWMLNLEKPAGSGLRDNILVSLGYRDGTDYSNKEELLTALENFNSYAVDHPDDTNSPLGDLLADLDPSDIGDISGQSEVTASQLAAMLHGAASNRSSRYYSHSTFAEMEEWKDALAEWAVPLTDGGTLYLLARDTGNVEMVYETETAAFSAFFYQPGELHELITRVGETYPMEILPYEADLNWDGTPDQLILRENPDGGAWSLQCHIGDDTVWGTEAYTAHVGWNAVFLCQMGGGDYLLWYQPYMGGGVCRYAYQLFHFQDGRQNRAVVVQENSIEFDLIFSPDYAESHQFDPQAIASFMEEINALLANSTQLLNTDQELLGTFEKEGRLYDSLWWLEDGDGFTKDDSKSLLENLTAFQAAAEQNSRNSVR